MKTSVAVLAFQYAAAVLAIRNISVIHGCFFIERL